MADKESQCRTDQETPCAVICPKYSFTGHAWWQPLLTWWTRLSKHPSFEESDYLIPTISKDGMGFIARPGQADRTLRWLKDALGRRGVPPKLFQDLTWHSFRVFIPDCAFQLGISRDQRRYLGNWMTESTADVYTREKRNVVVKVWHEVANNLSEISMEGRMVREDLSHPDWEGLPLAEPSPSKKSVKDSLFSESMDDDFTVVSPPKDQPPPLLEEDESGEIQEVPPLPEEKDSTLPSKTPEMAEDGYVTMEDLACRWVSAEKAREEGPKDLKFRDGENGFDKSTSDFSAMRLYQAVLQARSLIHSGKTPSPSEGVARPTTGFNIDALCDRVALEKDWTIQTGQPKPRLEYQGSDSFLKKQVRYCAKGEIGFFAPKHIVSALPEEGERPTKSHRKFTVDGFEKEEEEEERANPQTRRQLERMHTVFRNNLLMCTLAFPQFHQFDITKSDLDEWYDWFYRSSHCCGRRGTPGGKSTNSWQMAQH